jgi:hypothetical protein
VGQQTWRWCLSVVNPVAYGSGTTGEGRTVVLDTLFVMVGRENQTEIKPYRGVANEQSLSSL